MDDLTHELTATGTRFEAVENRIMKILRYASRRKKVKMKRCLRWTYTPSLALAFYRQKSS